MARSTTPRSVSSTSAWHSASTAKPRVPIEKSELSAFFVQPTRVVWNTKGVQHAASLLAALPGQAVLFETRPPLILPAGRTAAGILLDFGRELVGSVELFTPISGDKTPLSVRIRFGESVSEAMSELGTQGSQTDHAMRDQVVVLPWLGKITVGPSGFRFVRIDAVDPKREIRLTQVRAVLTLRDVPQVGSFRCSDRRLDQVWATGAWTVHLNMQDYLWDGVKRDRLVWLGDLHPEVAVVNAVFGHNPVVPKSLDLIRDATPATEWMNTISSYSMWWVIIHDDWYRHHGDRAYLREQQTYLTALLRRFIGFVAADGRERLDGGRFLDWPTSRDPVAVHEGLQALLAMTLASGESLLAELGDRRTAAQCRAARARLGRHQAPPSGRKAPAALSVLAGLRDPAMTALALQRGGPTDLSTFYGFYVLRALGRAGATEPALDFIRRYWGGMIDFGATSFWEDFDLAWTRNAGRIDELLPPGKHDLHAEYGADCYFGLRCSLAHGWAGGPTAFLSEHVLGITPASPGFRRVRITPNLGSLRWAEGSYPTPHGPITVCHERDRKGKVHSQITLPRGVKRVK